MLSHREWKDETLFFPSNHFIYSLLSNYRLYLLLTHLKRITCFPCKRKWMKKQSTWFTTESLIDNELFGENLPAIFHWPHKWSNVWAHRGDLWCSRQDGRSYKRFSRVDVWCSTNSGRDPAQTNTNSYKRALLNVEWNGLLAYRVEY